MTRREWFRRTLGAVVAAQLNAAGLCPRRVVPPTFSIAELNAVTQRQILPGITDNFFRQTPLMSLLAQRAPLDVPLRLE